MIALAPPMGLLAELTHRCPLSCAYCSNPVDLERRSAELDTATWAGIFKQAAELGVLHVHLSGGEPTARGDIVELTRAASQAGLYTNLITSGIGVTSQRLGELSAAGLDHLQLSVQDVREDDADRVAGLPGAHVVKRRVAREAVALGLPLTINVVVHRGNLARLPEMVADALSLEAGRIEIAHAQYYGWALANRAFLMPTREQVERSRDAVARLREEHGSAIAIDYVSPDYFSRFPKACMHGWGSRTLNVTPSGVVMPCHAAASIPGLVFWNARDRPLGEIWRHSPAFQAFRGTQWMQEPCASCERRAIDFGGCRCQAFALTGDPRATDPVCERSPQRSLVDQVLGASSPEAPQPRQFRRRE